MNYSAIHRCLGLAGVVCSLLLFSACATTENAAIESKKSGIEERVMGRWDAYLNGDLSGTYEYLSPAVRSSVSSLQYQRSLLAKKVVWTSADYIESECEETVCNVRILLGFTVYGALPGVSSFKDTQEIDESWVLVDGNWYFVPAQ